MVGTDASDGLVDLTNGFVRAARDLDETESDHNRDVAYADQQQNRLTEALRPNSGSDAYGAAQQWAIAAAKRMDSAAKLAEARKAFENASDALVRFYSER